MQIFEKLEELESIQIVNDVDTWQTSIELCFKPLLEKKFITPQYISSVKQQGQELNFYFILTLGLAMPHARPEEGVLKNGLSFLLIKNGVQFEDHCFNPVYCLIGLAAKDSDSHISIMMNIAELFGDNPKIIDRLKECSTKNEILTILKNKN